MDNNLLKCPYILKIENSVEETIEVGLFVTKTLSLPKGISITSPVKFATYDKIIEEFINNPTDVGGFKFISRNEQQVSQEMIFVYENAKRETCQDSIGVNNYDVQKQGEVFVNMTWYPVLMDGRRLNINILAKTILLLAIYPRQLTSLINLL